MKVMLRNKKVTGHALCASMSRHEAEQVIAVLTDELRAKKGDEVHCFWVKAVRDVDLKKELMRDLRGFPDGYIRVKE